MRGGVVVSSGGAAFRDPRLFDRNNFTSLVTTVPTESASPTRAHPGGGAPRRAAAAAAPRTGGGARPAPPRIAASSPHGAALSSRSDRAVSFFFSLILALVYKIYITRCS